MRRTPGRIPSCSPSPSASTVIAGLCLLGATPVMAQQSADESVLPGVDTESGVVQTDVDDTADEEAFVLESVVVTAEEQARQALGVSQITAEDIARSAVVNDASEVVRKMPGVNLTGATASGQRGNQRQIDIRGMGPENTLILIDGKPVLSRNSVKMSRGGERDTRGDSNWVPAELIERIEVLRGPAAARYGSGSSGGVVNIITRQPDSFTAQISTFTDQPGNENEGETYRANLMVGGPLTPNLYYRVHANYNRTEADDIDVNPERESVDDEGVVEIDPPLAGMEGVVNQDIGALLKWQIDAVHSLDLETAFSRQGNLYAGDSRNGTVHETVGERELIGEETNRMYRFNLALTHRGEYGFGESMSYLQWENTRNSRLCAGTAGGGEDNITNCVDTDGDGENDATAFNTITLDNINAKSEWNLPMDVLSRSSNLTIGGELRSEKLDDAVSIRGGLDESLVGETGVPADSEDRDPVVEQFTVGPYVELNMQASDRLTLTPAVRFDYNDSFGESWSPSLNAAYQATDRWQFKLGLARAFKTPNLYQLNPNFVYVTRGNGCPWVDGERLSGPCYVLGNPDLQAEHSLNKELGIAYSDQGGVEASLTFFHNDYTNRIGSGFTQFNDGAEENRLFRWENQEEAVVSGLEGNMSFPIGASLDANVNLTHIIESEDKSNGQPLSLVPEYTINASLDWYVRHDVSLTLSATHYGEIEAATLSSTTNSQIADTDPRDPYTLLNIGGLWQITEHARVKGGITNIANESVQRTGEGANTFNEPERSFYMGLDFTF